MSAMGKTKLLFQLLWVKSGDSVDFEDITRAQVSPLLYSLACSKSNIFKIQCSKIKTKAGMWAWSSA